MSASAGKKPKVLIIVENLPVPFDTRVWQEANTLTQAGYTVTVICPTGKGYEQKEEVLNGITIYRHGMPKEGSGAVAYFIEYSAALFHEFRLALKALFKPGFDIIHACNPPDLIFLVALPFKFLLGKKFIFDHHDINPELYIAKFGRKGFFYQLLLLMERWTFALADLSIATNESYRKIAFERGKMKSDRVFIVRSGPRLERLKIQPPSPELKQGKTYMVGYVGVIGEQEGLDYLLDAAAYLKNEKARTDILFACVGSGPHLESLKARSEQMGLADTVVFPGRVSDEVLMGYLNTADVCVNSDEYNDMNDKSTMNKVLEYMALAKPIVQFDLTEGRYSAQEASLYAERNNAKDMAEKILWLLDNPEERERMGQYGRARVENELQWAVTSQNLLKAYESL